MRKSITYIFCFVLAYFTFANHIYAQGSEVWERVYIATDKQTYIAGDKVWCSVYCLTGEGGVNLSDFSSTVYLELQTNDQVVLTAKIALINGRGAGALELPPTLPTGNYMLAGYTKQNRNEEGFMPDGKLISVFNVLTTERVEGGVDIVDDGEQGNVILAPAKYGDFDVRLPESVKPGEEFYVTLKNGFNDALSINVSIFNRDPYLEREDYGILSYRSHISQSGRGEITDKYLPDYEGEVIDLVTRGVKDNNIHVSFYGNKSNYFVPTVDDFGRARVVTPNVFGDLDMFYQGAETASIEDPFIRKVNGGIPSLKLSRSIEKELLDRGFSMQVGKRFDADTLYERLPVRPNIFFDKPDKVYNLDDYTRFSTMEEVLVEYVLEIRIRKENKKKFLSVMMDSPGAVISNPQFPSGIPLILLDGIPVTDHQKIIDYDPLLVERIDVYMDPFSIGTRYYEGVANFVTYKGDMSGFEFGSSVKILPYKGALYPLAFTGETIQENGDYPDYRQTIYWHPILDLKGKESREIRCIAPLYDGDFEIVVEGISSEGEVIYYRNHLNVDSQSLVQSIEDALLVEKVSSIQEPQITDQQINRTLKVQEPVVDTKTAPVPVAIPVAVSTPADVKAQTSKASQTSQKPREVAAEKQGTDKRVPATIQPKQPKQPKKRSDLPIRKEREGELKQGVKYKSSIEIR